MPIVLGGEQLLQQMVAQSLRLGGPVFDGSGEAIEPVVRGLATTLHEPVGVEDQRPARTERFAKTLVLDILDSDPGTRRRRASGARMRAGGAAAAGGRRWPNSRSLRGDRRSRRRTCDSWSHLTTSLIPGVVGHKRSATGESR